MVSGVIIDVSTGNIECHPRIHFAEIADLAPASANFIGDCQIAPSILLHFVNGQQGEPTNEAFSCISLLGIFAIKALHKQHITLISQGKDLRLGNIEATFLGQRKRCPLNARVVEGVFGCGKLGKPECILVLDDTFGACTTDAGTLNQHLQEFWLNGFVRKQILRRLYQVAEIGNERNR